MSKKKKSQDVSARRRRAQERGRIPWSYVIPAVIILLVIVGVLYVSAKENTSSTGSVLPPPGNHKFPYNCLTTETLAYHVHPWLRIIIDGKNVTIPPGVGMEGAFVDGTASNGVPFYAALTCYEPLHTHDDTGIIHIESPTNTNYTLGNFFQVWAATYAYELFNGSQRPIVFNNTDVLGFTADSSHQVLLIVDGRQEPTSFNYDSLVLDTLDYCNSTNSASLSSPCYASAQGNPSWNIGNGYPYGTGHTIVIEYVSA